MRRSAMRLYHHVTPIAALLASLAASPPIRADQPAASDGPFKPEGLLPVPDYSADFWNSRYLSGDWLGTRPQLANKGIQLDVDWTQYAQSIVTGGRERTSRYGGHLDYLLRLDLMRMNLVPGGLITIRGETRYGNSVNAQAGPLLPVNTLAMIPLTQQFDQAVPVYVTDLYYTQVFSEQFAVSIGKADSLNGDPNEFASGRGKSQFMDFNFVFDSVLPLRLPYSTLGVATRFSPSRYLTIKADIVNTPDSSSTTGFENFGKGATAALEAITQYRLGELPGGMNFGGVYCFAQDVPHANGIVMPPPGQIGVVTKSDTWATYWSGWQYLYVQNPTDKPINLADGLPDHQGVGVFWRLGLADKNSNPIAWSGSFGFSGRGLIPSRPNDIYGIGYYYTRLHETPIGQLLRLRDESQGFEAFYNVAVTPAARLTFDVQIHRSVFPTIDPAVILGVRLNLSF